MRSVLCLSDTLYDWDKEAPANHQVYFDDLHQHVVHQQPSTFCTFNITRGACASQGVTVNLNTEGLRLVRLCPDLSHFAALYDKKRLLCREVTQSNREPLNIKSKWDRTDLDVLDFFWLPPGAANTEAGCADLVIITSHGVELLRVYYSEQQASSHQRVLKSVKAFPTSVRMCWIEPMSGIALVCTGPRTLQPFELRSKTPQKMPKFDLILGRNKVIEANDVAVMTIYEATFCIHCDGATSRVSLRNISNLQQGTPEHDIVIDVQLRPHGIDVEGEAKDPTGPLRLSKVDNFLIVHCIEKGVSTLFDIRHKERGIVPSLCMPTAFLKDESTKEVLAQRDWQFASGSIIIDARQGGFGVRQLQINVDGVLQELQLRIPHDLSTMLKLLLRRTNCRENMVQTLRAALSSKTKCFELAQAFEVLNKAYRQTIEGVSRKAQSPGPRGQSSVSLNELETVIGQQSILSEKDMVSLVFFPHFIATSAPVGFSHDRDPPVSVSCDTWQIPLPEGEVVDDADGDQSRPCRSPYIASIVIAYLRSLLSMQILPHKILQCFVFDICMYFRQEHTLQQLLHYHVLLDSTELVLRLKNVSVKRRVAWATQSCLDMALRLREFGIVADMLLLTRQYLDIVPFLVTQRSADFKIQYLLQKIESDTESTNDDPDLLEHVLSEIRLWRHEALAEPGQIAAPDLTDCEKWLPELITLGGPAEASTAEAQGVAVAA